MEFISTEEWVTTSGGAKRACTFVSAKLSPSVTIPLSVRGLDVEVSPFSVRVPSEAECSGAALTVEDLQQLSTTSSLPQTFMEAIAPSLPAWLRIAVDEAQAGELTVESDFFVKLIPGPEVVAIPNCQALPVFEDSFYAVVLWSKASVVIVDGTSQAVPAQGEAFCIAVDVARYPGANAEGVCEGGGGGGKGRRKRGETARHTHTRTCIHTTNKHPARLQVTLCSCGCPRARGRC